MDSINNNLTIDSLNFNKDVYYKLIPHKPLDEISESFVDSLKVSEDFIHKRYVSYSRQTQEQRDSTKTEFIYLNPLNINEWTVPNLSRKSICSVRISSHLTENSNREIPIDSSSEQSSDSDTQSVRSLSSATVYDSPKTPMFTNIHWLAGSQCESGQEVNKKVRKRGHKYQESKVSAQEVKFEFSGCGREPQIGDEDNEEIIDVRRVLFKSFKINYLFIWLLFKWFLFLAFIGLFNYLISQHMSSRMLNDINLLKNDLRQLKGSN